MNATAIIDALDTYSNGNPHIAQFLCTCNSDWAFGSLIIIVMFIFWLLGYITGGNIAKQP